MPASHRSRSDFGLLGFLGLRALVDADLVHAAALGVEDLDDQAVDLEALADRRHAADVRHQVAADGLEALALDLEPEALHHFVDVDLAAEHEAAVALVDDRLGLDVVLVADLADDLLEKVLDRDQPGGAAVLVDDDRDLRLLPLELLEELGHALALGHHHDRPGQVGDSALVVGVADRDEILHEDEAGDVVEVLAIHGKARVLLLAEERAQIADGRLVPDRDDVGARRHHLADQRVPEVDDALEQLPDRKSV